MRHWSVLGAILLVVQAVSADPLPRDPFAKGLIVPEKVKPVKKVVAAPKLKPVAVVPKPIRLDPPITGVTLVGIVQGEHDTALLECGGQIAMVRSGDELRGGIRVIRVGRAEVQLQRGNSSITLPLHRFNGQ